MNDAESSRSGPGRTVKVRCPMCRCLRDMKYITHQVKSPMGDGAMFTYGFFECPVCTESWETDWEPGEDLRLYQ